MQIKIVSPHWGYSSGTITFSASVQIATDDYNEAEGTGQILWSDSFSGKREVSDPSDWYPLMKAELLRKAQEIVTLFISNMSAVLTKTGKQSIDEIITDVVNYVEGNL